MIYINIRYVIQCVQNRLINGFILVFITKSKCFYNFFSTIATIDKFGQIANMNKTGFGISKVKKTVSQKARKHSYTRSISTTSHITANICVFASGRVLPSSAMYENCFLIKWNIQSEHTECKQYCLNLRHSDSSINILNRMCHRGR